MVQQRSIPADEVAKILALEEGHFVDLKQIDIKPAKLTETVSAFANAGGGEIFLGIEERAENGVQVRAWRGFTDMEDANAHLQTVEALSPLGSHYHATFLISLGQPGSVLHLDIPKSKDIVLGSDGKAYIRRGAGKLPVATPAALERLRLDKGIASFEDQTLAIEKICITNSLVTLRFLLSVVPSGEPEEWLQSQNLLIAEKPVVAGILLFADSPQAALPKRSAIKILRYKTKDAEGSRETLAFTPDTVEGCLYDQIKGAVARTKNIVEDIKRLGKTGLEPVVYPDETLHEIITNAVLHRDYSIAADVQIRIYDDRIEVESAGRLPGHMTPQNILTEQFARNPKLVRLINKFPDPPNKDVGEGLNTAFDAMKKLRLREPEIVENENSVTVFIRHSPLASPHEAVLEYLNHNNEVTNSIARSMTGIRSENSMKDVFIALKKRKLIEPVPGKRGNASAWRSYTGFWEVSGDMDFSADVQALVEEPEKGDKE